jgi:hypothetical protein
MQIHDGIVVIEEVLHELRVKKILGIALKLDFEKAYEDFFEEVLMKKGFYYVWISWVMRSVNRWSLPINISGEQGSYFYSSREVRKGDPISPFFDFVVEGRAAIVENAKSSGHISGHVSHLLPGGVKMLRYADGTVVLLEKTDSTYEISVILL